MSYRYEMHLHTSPVSKCAKAAVMESLEFYKKEGFDGVFLTNHFIDGNINGDRSRPYEEQLEFYCSDYEEAVKIGEQIGLKVFFGVEMSYGGTDFLVYGLDKAWFMAHPEIMSMPKSKELPYLRENGALVIQAHPFREAGYIDHIRLFPRCVDGVEVFNACRKDFENKMASIYAENYNLQRLSGTDNHVGPGMNILGGMSSWRQIESVNDFIELFKSNELSCFKAERDENTGSFVFCDL